MLAHEPGSTDYGLRKQKTLWWVAFAFAFRGGTVGALHGGDFTFSSDFTMSVRPDVLKRTKTDCTRSPHRRFYTVPESIDQAGNPVRHRKRGVSSDCLSTRVAVFLGMGLSCLVKLMARVGRRSQYRPS